MPGRGESQPACFKPETICLHQATQALFRMERNDMNDKDASSGLLERARKCKTPEEMRAIVQESGQPLSDDLLEELSGGCSNVGTVNTRCMLVY